MARARKAVAVHAVASLIGATHLAQPSGRHATGAGRSVISPRAVHHQQPPSANSTHIRDSSKIDGRSAANYAVSRHIAIRSIRSSKRRVPTISVAIRSSSGKHDVVINGVMPDSGAEVTVAGVDILHSLGVHEADLHRSTFDLVMANKKVPLLSIGQLDITIKYGSTEAVVTVAFCPEMSGMLLSWTD